jgi:hypothetical protein
MSQRLPTLFGSLIMVALIMFGSLQQAMAEQRATKEYQVKAAIIYRIIKFIKWPHKFENRKSFNFCFTGEDNFHNALDQLETQRAKGLKISVKKDVKNSELLKCDVVFVGHTEKSNIKEIMDITRDHPILLAGEDKNFAKDGGAIRLFKFNSKIKFNVNIIAFKNANLTISSDMLKSAKKIFRGKKSNDR